MNFEIDKAGEGGRQSESCPDPRVIQAFVVGGIPDSKCRAVESHLQHCPICRILAEGFREVEPELVDEGAKERVWSQIQQGLWNEGAQPSRIQRLPAVAWVSAMAAVLLLTVGIGIRIGAFEPRIKPVDVGKVQPAVVQVSIPTIPLEKPEILLPVEVLMNWRGGVVTGDYYGSLVEALKPFQKDDYAAAATSLEKVAAAYPDRHEVLFYLGVSRLFLEQNQEAATWLARVMDSDDPEFSRLAGWYGAIVDVRLGEPSHAVSKLEVLCQIPGRSQENACEVLKEIAAK